ncbi:MAG: HAD family hydrolase [Flavobacteriia bacterium]|jgi:FMN phosphatase YigB (HAD superfamily)
MKISDFDAIIFDLGGVILPIDYNKTADAFKDLGLVNFDELYSQANQSGLFDRFEIGEISAQHFVNSILDFLPSHSNANKVVAAWNAMLLDFPKENLEFLEEVKSQNRTFLLSNTNEIHVQAFNRKLKSIVEKESLHPYFEQVYFSNEIGKRKPHPETFAYICEINNLNPKNTLFIDDSIQHIEGAKKTGLQTYHIQKDEKIIDILK